MQISNDNTMAHRSAPVVVRQRRVVRARRERGVVIIIVLLALILLAALVFYVMNVGRATNARVVTQHAADATAAAGAGHVARSFNTVAMNNVAMSRQIALINVLDSMPLAIDLTVKDETEDDYDDLEALAIAVPAQLRAGVSDPWFQRLLQQMELVVVEEDNKLTDLDTFFRENPDYVTNMTFYNAPMGEHGFIWQAMFALDDINQAVMDDVQLMAHLSASEGGMANLPQSGPTATNAAALAIVAEFPWQRGHFADFERPVLRGLLPEDIDDDEFNRGPYDTIFGWRSTDGSSGGGGQIPGPSLPPITGGPSAPRPATRYSTYGTQGWMIRQIDQPHPYHRLRYWARRLANIKASYVWPGNDIQVVIDPVWEVDIERDNERSTDENDTFVRGIVAEDRGSIHETLFVIAEIKSRTPNNPGSPASQGVTWNYINRPGRARPFLLRRGGWVDPAGRNPLRSRSATPPRYEKINNHIWRWSGTYYTNPLGPDLGGDPEIGLPPVLDGRDPDGNPIYKAQLVYWTQDIMLVGVNTGPEIEVRNPYEGFDKTSVDAPAPIDFVRGAIPNDNYVARRDYLTVLGITQQNDVALAMPTRFDAGKPYPYTVGIAQAKIFNNHSWDLWTQMWHAQLEPVSNFEQWVEQLGNYRSDAPYVTQAADLQEYLSSLEKLADKTLSH